MFSDSPTAKGILTFISTIQFLATTHFLADVLSHLSKTFQMQWVDFTVDSNVIESAVAALTEILSGIKFLPVS